MHSLLIALILLVVCGALIWHWGMQPAKHRQLTSKRLHTLLDVLLHRGLDGGVLYIDRRRAPHFIQVSKYLGDNGPGLQLGFPDAAWSRSLFAAVQSLADREGLPYDEVRTGRADTTRFLHIDFGRDLYQAEAFIQELAHEVLDFDIERDAVAYFRNVSTDPNARIGF